MRLRVIPVSHSNPKLPSLCACLIAIFVCHTVHAQPQPDNNTALDRAFMNLVKLEQGQDLGVFDPIRQAVVASRTDEQVRADLESRLVAVLGGAATELGKDFACRQLGIVGSDAAIPALASLLPDPRMSHMARYALEGIGSSAAKKTLREMLGETEGRQRVGVVISLGRLADAEAVSVVNALLEEESLELREVCLVALGRIGTIPAAEALQAFSDETPEELREVVTDALLNLVESLCRQQENPKAVEICEVLLKVDAKHVRAAAFRGLLAAKPSGSLSLVIDGLKSDEDWKQAVAADWVVGLENPEEVQEIASAITELPTAGKVAVFVSLKHRCHPAIREAALKGLSDSDIEVRKAALATLIRSGTPAEVPALATLMTDSTDKSVRDAAFETLRLMPEEGVNEALINWMHRSQELPRVAVQCALARRSREFVPALLKVAETGDGDTRLEAFRALEIMATEKEADALVTLLCGTAAGDEREAASRAVWMVCQKIADPKKRSVPLLAAMAKGDNVVQCATLPTLARLGSQEALPTIHEAMKSSDQAVRDAGYRAIANWPDASVADELLEIAKASGVVSYRIWALRAYARVIALPSERAPQNTFEMLRDAMKLATRREDKELFVSRMASVRVPDALTLLLSFIDEGELTSAAIPAVFTLAKGLSQSHPDQAAAALRRIQPMTQDAALQQLIPKVLHDIEARKKDRG